MFSIKSRLQKLEQRICPKSGPVDPEILKSIAIFNERLNKNKLHFTDEQKALWVELFGHEPEQVSQDECLRIAQATTDQYGSFKNYIKAIRDNGKSRIFDKIKNDPDRKKLFFEMVSFALSRQL